MEKPNLKTTIRSLPFDVLLLIIVEDLTPRDLLSFCSTCKLFQQDQNLRFAPSYWSSIVKSTFRVPNQPVSAADGKRWMRLYRRMRQQTRTYCWGNNDGGSLGSAAVRPIRSGDAVRLTLGQPNVTARIRGPRSSGWPLRNEIEGAGVIADLQCGGWSTVVLNAKGQIFVRGTLNGQRISHNTESSRRLSFPKCYSTLTYNSQTAIHQMSVGRTHVLGLADDGKIWTWDDKGFYGLQIKFLAVDLSLADPSAQRLRQGQVTKVVAGWNRSSAYVHGKGIVVWGIVNSMQIIRSGTPDEEIDCSLVPEAWIVPHTGRMIPSDSKRSRRSRAPGYSVEADHDTDIGQVTNWIVLSDFVVFTTDLGKVFAAHIPEESQEGALCEPIEVKSERENFVVDVQGSHATFALLTLSGEVLIADQSVLSTRSRAASTEPELVNEPSFQKIPALQNSGVISLAFGDWHYHALHSDGTISSYGREPQQCGALGLGAVTVGPARGLSSVPRPQDIDLLPQCLTTGRKVVFDEEKRDWLTFVFNDDRDGPNVAFRRHQFYSNDEMRAYVSEYFEERLRDWQYAAPTDEDDGLPAYYALSVAAAGWHSGALVLVNEEKVARNRALYRVKTNEPVTSTSRENSAIPGFVPALLIESAKRFLGLDSAVDDEKNYKWTWLDETFPRLRLSDGTVMPGEVPVLDWKPPKWLEVEHVTL